MVDFTVRQWDIQQSIADLNKDIQLLQDKNAATQEEQQVAIEHDDYDKADALDMRMKQTQKLIESKEYKIRQMEENNLS